MVIVFDWSHSVSCKSAVISWRSNISNYVCITYVLLNIRLRNALCSTVMAGSYCQVLVNALLGTRNRTSGSVLWRAVREAVLLYQFTNIGLPLIGVCLTFCSDTGIDFQWSLLLCCKHVV